MFQELEKYTDTLGLSPLEQLRVERMNRLYAAIVRQSLHHESKHRGSFEYGLEVLMASLHQLHAIHSVR